MTKEDRLAHEQWRADCFNSNQGKCEGYDCPHCRNRGLFAYVDDHGAVAFRSCKCQALRAAQRAMTRSGLPPQALTAYTFQSWQTPEPWQARALAMAKEYARRAVMEKAFTPWLVLSGRPGCGKTMLCTAAFQSILAGGRPGLYLSWRDFARRAKGAANDGAAYDALLREPKNTPMLYLDDFWKGSVTAGDVHLAFELLNHRYIAGLPTILSSEHTIASILRGDEALGSRLAERARGYYLDLSSAKDWRRKAG